MFGIHTCGSSRYRVLLLVVVVLHFVPDKPSRSLLSTPSVRTAQTLDTATTTAVDTGELTTPKGYSSSQLKTKWTRRVSRAVNSNTDMRNRYRATDFRSDFKLAFLLHRCAIAPTPVEIEINVLVLLLRCTPLCNTPMSIPICSIDKSHRPCAAACAATAA